MQRHRFQDNSKVGTFGIRVEPRWPDMEWVVSKHVMKHPIGRNVMTYGGWLTIISSRFWVFFCRVYFKSLLTFSWGRSAAEDDMEIAASGCHATTFSCDTIQNISGPIYKHFESHIADLRPGQEDYRRSWIVWKCPRTRLEDVWRETTYLYTGNTFI